MTINQRQIKNYDTLGNMPESWIITTDDLLASADILKEKRMDYYKNTIHTLKVGQTIPAEGKILNCEIMLKGFAAECLLKALWVKAGNKIARHGKLLKIPNVGNHKLVQLINKLRITINEKQITARTMPMTCACSRPKANGVPTRKKPMPMRQSEYMPK
jgi:hypothetical protein